MSKSIIPSTPNEKDYASSQSSDLGWIDSKDPVSLFSDWLSEAIITETNDANAMSVATVDKNGMPDVRVVLLKDIDHRGFVFYSNSESNKGQQLSFSNKVALGFHWKSKKRQVRVRGAAEVVASIEADAYFASRARGSRISAWASNQSRPVKDRETMMNELNETEARFEGTSVPRPNHWLGWRVKPEYIEFWQDGAYRFHDRLAFSMTSDGWVKGRLYP
jgi:pyridoxamine 5'-phosphate oxidase